VKDLDPRVTYPAAAAEIGELIRCLNWEANPALCGPDCQVIYPPSAAAERITVAAWLHTQDWLTVENAVTIDDAPHLRIRCFCSWACLLDWLQREHPDIVKLVADRAWIRDLAELRAES